VRLERAGKGPRLLVEPAEPAATEERLALLSDHKADFSVSLLLTRAPLAGPLTTTRRPDLSAADEAGVRHDAFRIIDFASHVELQGLVKNAEAIVAEGQDLYEAALAFSKDPAAAKLPGAKYKLCAIVDENGPGLVLAPVHRLVAGLPDWNPGQLLYAATDFFETRPFASPAEALAALDGISRLRPAFVVIAPPEEPVLLALRDRPLVLPWPADRSEAWRNLDAAALDVAFLSRLLAADPAALEREGKLSFTPDTSAALAAVEKREAQAAILMRPMTISQIETVVHAGERLPRRSTSFYPPLFSGLFGVSLEDPVY